MSHKELPASRQEPAASSQDERQEPAASSQDQPKEKKAKKKAFDFLKPVPPASPASDAGDAGDLEVLDVQSDSEEERRECKAVLENMDVLIKSQEAREKRRAEAAGEQVSQSRLDVLITLQRLMQMHVAGEDTKLDELIAVQERMLNSNSATSQDKERQAKDAATSPTSDSDEGEPPVPQAREFMGQMGFTSWDEVKEGRTLVHHCCYEASKRNMFFAFVFK